MVFAFRIFIDSKNVPIYPAHNSPFINTLNYYDTSITINEPRLKPMHFQISLTSPPFYFQDPSQDSTVHLYDNLPRILVYQALR